MLGFLWKLNSNMGQRRVLTMTCANAYTYAAAPHWAVGFLQARSSAQGKLCAKRHIAFFYALMFLVGGVLGGVSLASRRSLCKPDISSAAQVFAGFDGGLIQIVGAIL